MLQFFDTLALYFQLTHTEARKEAKFLNVPDGKGTDQTLTINPKDNGTYALSPFPFAGDALTVQTQGRSLTAQPAGTDFKAIFANTPKQAQTYTLVAG